MEEVTGEIADRNINNRLKAYKFHGRFSYPEKVTEIEMLVHNVTICICVCGYVCVCLWGCVCGCLCVLGLNPNPGPAVLAYDACFLLLSHIFSPR